MKELSVEEKAKRYDEAIEIARKEYKNHETFKGFCEMLVHIFPELKKNEDSEDEKTRKELIEQVVYIVPNDDEVDSEGNVLPTYQKRIDKYRAWLEKQGSEPNWVHHNVDLSNCSEEYRKAYYDGWNNCNMQHSQCKSESDDVIKCLINGMKFYYEANKEATWGTDKWSMPVKHIIEVLEQILANSAKTCKNEQKPAKWSEEDEKLLALSLNNLTELKDRFGEEYGRTGDCIEWLKSLKDRYTWKPSDEQINELGKYCPDNTILTSLYEQLKKLTE